MKYTAEGLRDTLLSMIEEMGNHPEQYAENPGKDFTRRRSLTLPALMKLILTMDEKSVWKGLLGYFGNEIDTPSAGAFVQQRKSCCLVHFLSCSTVSPMRWLFRKLSWATGCWPQTALP
ncbi:hypothetical protein [uncultured Oscillibacter sp.]|uniref:hypothetical protein n=1 Tax=uncultured Oscillibacter sp. TaxID=876091 RepID=UPI0025CBA04C|nr:hypothetical protein [uncultured Oscillibacter sp.]